MIQYYCDLIFESKQLALSEIIEGYINGNQQTQWRWPP